MRLAISLLILAVPLCAEAPCCSVTAAGRDGVVAAKVNASNTPFEFRLDLPKAFQLLKAGQPVYANFKSRQVSVDGKTAAGSILRVSCPPPAACPASASACKDAGPDYCPASVRIPSMCKTGYYGANCSPCPGAPSNVCSSHGACRDGIYGNGSCACNNPYSGPYCQSTP
jgi:hypothetical protein